MLDAADGARLAEALTVAHYTSDGVEAARTAAGAVPGSALDTLLQLFEYGRAVQPGRLADALSPLSLDRAVATGIIEVDSAGARAAVYIQPYAEWWLLADLPRRLRPGPLEKDHVLGATELPARLARAVVRDPVRSALDLCCGSGVQSLHLSAHAGMVTATDLSLRALSFAASTAALNGLDWRLLHGDLFEPVRGQQFDLVVSNPPFVVGPGSIGYFYRDAGWPGDQLGAYLASAAPSLLNEGGLMQYVTAWAHVSGQDWTERVARWVAGTGMDAWFIQLDIRDAAEYVRAWTTDPGSAADREWLGWLRRHDIEAVSCGLITLRKAGRADPAVRVDDLAGRDISGGDVSAWFGRQDWLRDNDLLASRFRAVDGLLLQMTARLGTDGWRTDRYQLMTRAGPQRTDEVSDLVALIVASCDGSLPLAEQLAKLAAQRGIDSAELLAAAVPAVSRLVEDYIIEPLTAR